MENDNYCNCKKTWFIIIALIILIALIWFIVRISCCAAEQAGACPAKSDCTIEQITAENFNDKTSQGIVLVEFFSPDCTICQGQAAAIEEVVALLPDGVAIMQINYDQEASCANQHQVKTVPTWIKFKDGKEIKRFTGMLDKEGLKKFACDDEKTLGQETEKCLKDTGKAVKKCAKDLEKEVKSEADELKTF